MYNAMLKRTEVRIEGISFFIAPFPVFVAARISAMLSKVLSPVLGGIISLLGDDEGEMEGSAGTSFSEAKGAIPTFVDAMNGLNPLEFERLLRELLINSRNITFRDSEHPEGAFLTEEELDAMFAGNSQNLYILAYHVLKENFQGFFGKLKNLSGSPLMKKLTELSGSNDTESSTPDSSQSSNSDVIPLSRQGYAPKQS